MDNRLTFLYYLSGVKWGRKWGIQPSGGHLGAKRGSDEGVGKSAPERRRDGDQVNGPICREKPLNVEGRVLVPQTDTGRRVEDTKANGKTFVKEFGNLTPYVRKKGCLEQSRSQ
jgi:hypothetical protein